jgi:hypothetical protein
VTDRQVDVAEPQRRRPAGVAIACSGAALIAVADRAARRSRSRLRAWLREVRRYVNGGFQAARGRRSVQTLSSPGELDRG